MTKLLGLSISLAVIPWVVMILASQTLAQGTDGYHTDRPGGPLLFGDQYSAWHTDRQGGPIQPGPYTGGSSAQVIDGYHTDRPGGPLLFGDQYSTWHTDRQGGPMQPGPYTGGSSEDADDKDENRD